MRFLVVSQHAALGAWSHIGGQKIQAPLCYLSHLNSSGSGALFMIEARDDVLAATVPVPALDGLGIDDQKLSDLTKCMLDFRGMVKPIHFTGVTEDGREFRD